MPRHLTDDDVRVGTTAPDPARSPFWVKTTVSPPELLGWDSTEEVWVEVGGGGGGGAFCETVGDGTTTSFDVAHELATDCVLVEAIEVTSGDALVHGTDYTWLILDVDTIRIVFTVAPATDDVRVAVSSGGGAAGGGSTVPAWIEHLAVPDDSPVWADEFDGAALDPSYVEVVVTGTTEWTQRRGVLAARTYSQSSSDVNALLFPRALAVGEAVETCFSMLSIYSNYLMAGPIITDGVTASSDIVYAMPYVGGSNGAGTVVASTRGGTLTGITSPSTSNVNITRGHLLFCRITRTDTNLWLTEYSADGVEWTSLGQGALSRTLTPTHIGLGVTVWGGGSAHRLASFDYLRVYDLS